MYEYNAIITSVYDGDTLTANVDLGLKVWHNGAKLRLLGVDTPEMRGGTKEEKIRAIAARDFVREMCQDKMVRIVSKKTLFASK